MLELVRKLLISVLLPLAVLVSAPAQNPTTTQAQPRALVFSGFVTDFTPASLSVSRKNATGGDMVHKSFTLDPHTKVEGKIKLKARVTVQFTIDGDTNRAVRVIVRGS